MLLSNSIFSMYPVIESLTRYMTVSHLYSLDIRRIIGEEGVRKVCDPIRLFREIFNEPHEFNKIFLNGNMTMSGFGVAEYIYTGKIEASKDAMQRINLYVNYRGYKELDEYLKVHENISIGSSEYDPPMYQGYRLSSNILIELYTCSRNVEVEAKYCDMPIVTENTIEINHIISVPDKRWHKNKMGSIEFGIPEVDIFKRMYCSSSTRYATIPVYTHDEKREYEAFLDLVSNTEGSEQCVDDSMLISYSLLILSCGMIDDVIHPKIRLMGSIN